MDYRFLLDRSALSLGSSQQRVLYTNLRSAIASRRLAAGHRLPGTRDLSQQLNIARNSVVYAYEQLHAEGYLLTSRVGTRVAARVATPRALRSGAGGEMELSRRARTLHPASALPTAFLPFTVGQPALSEFPVREWQRTLRGAASRLRAADLEYGHPGGSPYLRTVLSERLRAAREVECEPEQVLIVESTQSALQMLAYAVADQDAVVWMETPGYTRAAATFRAQGLTVVPVPVDTHGMTITTKGRDKPRLIYVTPSHQYPLGYVMSRERRLALLAAAAQFRSIVLEDDYDSDFRYDGQPLPALQGLVADSPVIYLGTFSKTMFPGLRLAYVVIPKHLSASLYRLPFPAIRIGRSLEQAALAAYIDRGLYTKHLRKMRMLYAERQQALREALSRALPDLEVLGTESGLHLVLGLPSNASDVAVCERVRAMGLNPAPLSEFHLEPGKAKHRQGLALGFGNTGVDDIRRGIRILARAMSAGRLKRPSA